MPWWRSANSPSSSASASSASSSPSSIRKDFSSFFSSTRKSGDAFSYIQPRLTRAPKLRNGADINEVGNNSSSGNNNNNGGRGRSNSYASTPVSRSPSNLDVAPRRSSSVQLPQPLPLPGVSPPSPTRKEGLVGRPLPSPREGEGNGGGDLLSPPASDAIGSATKSEASLWQKQKLIGSGTFGNVYVATNKLDGSLCAMKEVNLIPDDPKSAECLKQLEQEIEVLSQLKHPNIVQYYGCEMTEDHFYIFLEYVHPGSINKYVRDHIGAMTESVVRNFTRHILKGLAYLHNSKNIHRDIKGANLLVDVHGVVKLADFGMAKHLNGATGAQSLKGTPYWMAPEVVQAAMNKDIGYDYAVDIWSLGCTIIEMFTGKHPWEGLEWAAAMFKVLQKDPPIPDTLSSEGKNFLQLCFRRNPADRPTATMLLEHPFIRNSHHLKTHGSIHAFPDPKLTIRTTQWTRRYLKVKQM